VSELVLIPIKDLHRWEEDLVRVNGIDHDHVRELAEALAEVPLDQWPKPLVTPWDPEHRDEGYALLGGGHTVEVARQRGVEKLLCRVIPEGDWEDAFEDNRLHGLPPSLEDRKQHARRLAKRYPEMSYSEIGRRAGLSDKTVKRALGGNRSESPSARAKPRPLDRWFRQTFALERLPSAREVAQDIDAYDVAERSDVAAVYAMLGRTLVEAATPYLKGR
jgi:hypothetical protein